MARDLARCLVTSSGVSPGHDLKCPRWMARRKVEGGGLKAQPWRKAARSSLVFGLWTALFAWAVDLVRLGMIVGRAVDLGARGESRGRWLGFVHPG